MKKEILKIGIAVLVLFAIAIPLSLHREKEIAKNIADENSLRLIPFDLNTIDHIQATSKNGSVTLQRRKKDASGKFDDEFFVRDFEFSPKPDWIITSPFRAIADSMLIGSFFSALTGLVSDKTIQENQDRKKDYDLDPPQYSISFYDAGASSSKFTINMGSKNTADSGYYFSTSDKPGIYLADKNLQPFSEQRLALWRETKVLGFPSVEDLKSLKFDYVDKKNDSFEVISDVNGWKMAPLEQNLQADHVAIQKFSNALDTLRSTLIVDDPKLLVGAKPIAKAVLRFKSFEKPIEFTLSSNPKDPKLYFFKRPDLNEIFQVDKSDTRILPTYQGMVNKKLLDKSMDQITGMKVTRNNKIIDIAKESDVWKVKQPYQDDANPRRIESFINAIYDDEPGPGSYLPNKVLKDKDLSMRVEFSVSDQEKEIISFYEEGKNVYAKVEGKFHPRVLALSQMPLGIYEHMSHFRNDDMVPVSDEHIKRIVFVRKNAKVEIEQNEKKKLWFVKFLENVSNPISKKWKEEQAPEDLFNQVLELYITKFLPAVDPAEKYEEASLDIITDQNKQFSWKFGRKKGDMILVYSPDRNTAAAVSANKYEALLKFLEEPAKPEKKPGPPVSK